MGVHLKLMDFERCTVLTIRSIQQSHRWAAAWELLSARFRVEVIAVRKHGRRRESTPIKMAA